MYRKIPDVSCTPRRIVRFFIRQQARFQFVPSRERFTISKEPKILSKVAKKYRSENCLISQKFCSYDYNTWKTKFDFNVGILRAHLQATSS